MFVNKDFIKSIFSGFVYMALMVTCFQFQTTIWFHFFGHFPSPNLWLPLMIYLIMYRPAPLNFFWVLFFFWFLLATTSALPFFLLLSLFSLYAVVLFTQKRFSLLTMSDFILLTTSSLFIFPLMYYGFTLFHNSNTPLHIFNHLATFFITLPLIPPLLLVLQKIDDIFKSTEPHYDRFSTEI